MSVAGGVSRSSAAARARARRGLRRRLKFAAYALLRLAVNAALRPLVGLRIDGWRRMPRRGPLLVVANHLHNVDPVVISAALPRPLYYMGKRELFTHPVGGWVSRQFGAFPVNRGTIDRAALRQARALLDEGLAVGLFPEGTRSTTGALGPVQPGVALLALQSGVPILPVAISGTESLPFDAKATGRPRRGRPRVRVAVGRPFTLPPRPAARRAGDREELVAATSRIMREVAALLPPAYRGAYERVEGERLNG